MFSVGEKFIISVCVGKNTTKKKTQMHSLSANSHIVCALFSACVCLLFMYVCVPSARARPTAGPGRHPV